MANFRFSPPTSEDLRKLRGENKDLPFKKARKQGVKNTHGRYRK